MRKIYFLILSVFFISCSSTLDVRNNPEPDNPKYTYLALGDSYTIGESVLETDRWPVQLAEALRVRGYKVAPPKIIAKTGWTTANLIRGIDNELDVQREFDLVSILIGVNNQYQDRPITEYEEELRNIFRRAINYSKTGVKGVFAVSIPDYGYTPFGWKNQENVSEEIDRFNEVFRRVAEDFDVDFYNITPISREANDNPDLTASDDLHPSALQYKMWVDLFVNQVVQKLPE